MALKSGDSLYGVSVNPDKRNYCIGGLAPVTPKLVQLYFSDHLTKRQKIGTHKGQGKKLAFNSLSTHAEALADEQKKQVLLHPEIFSATDLKYVRRSNTFSYSVATLALPFAAAEHLLQLRTCGSF